MAPNMSLFSVNAILILNAEDGSRVFTKYYSPPHHNSSSPAAPYPDQKSQKAFEKGLLEKTQKQTADIILYDNRIVLYKSESDVMMYVVGGVDENEIMLYNVILALRDSLHLLFKYVFRLQRPGHILSSPTVSGAAKDFETNILQAIGR
ncbi:hypothetical protein OCU04_001092 [Sclerotinia nivalis]|uniref:Coatomer subunit zeta n=1 Tax=Sclerotinia nivalis TaxID=352851 RepID=A0A9X0AXE6_9HELO|nr:hypothetical protein OCU04_001092 [Sclerotinia nivalis]